MGASSQHPHCQIWATHDIPTNPASEQTNQKEYLVHHHAPLLIDYLRFEHNETSRIIYENKSFTLLVPFWAIWPYETMILPREHLPSITSLTDQHKKDLALLLKGLTVCYDNVFNTPFPYSMGIHQAPTDQKDHDEWQMHFHFYPPLLLSATIKKHLVGYEMLSEAQRDITPEDAAFTLKQLYTSQF
jgi:UDPglucose--hexose-1-phosphate uridylyltransferase